MSSSPDTTSSKSRLQHRDGQVGWHSSEPGHELGQTVKGLKAEIDVN